MFNNYLYLLRGLKELREIIIDKTIYDIYTQEKDKLFIEISSLHNQNITLIFSTQPQLSYISIKSDHKKAKKNTKDFIKESLPLKIKNVLIAENDRIIKFVLSNGEIFFSIRSIKSNVIFYNNSKYDFFKKVKDDDKSIISEILSQNFITPEESYNKIKNDTASIKKEELLKKYRFLDKSIIMDLQGGNWQETIIKLLESIMDDKICIISNDFRINILPYSLINGMKKYNNCFPTYFDAINRFISLKHIVKREFELKKQIEKFIDKELSKISNKLNDLKVKIENGSREKEFSNYGNLLLMNISNIKKGMDSLKVYDNTNNTEVIIKIDKTLSPSQNIEKYFTKSKDEKTNFQKSLTLYNNLENQYNRYISLQQQINSIDDYNTLLKIKKELGIKSTMEMQSNNKEISFRHFLIDNKYHLFVGKNSKNNDELTTKFAKQNDLWFHARSVSGSHVVLRVDNNKEAIPKNIIKKAASIAAYYSKAKTSKLASVSYTFKKYVTKRKSLEPGQVILLKEQVILVQPEIPDGCTEIE